MERFKENVRNAVDESEIDSLCIKWLLMCCIVNDGKEGDIAEDLLRICKKLLEI